MTAPLRTIEIDADTAALLEDSAAAQGMTVRELLAVLAAELAAEEPAEVARLREAGEGPYSKEALAEDARALEEFRRTRMGAPWDEVKTWLRSWGTDDELLPPKIRRL
jgi:hypothetical protein